MTARADIRNHRRKVLEERSKTAWEKGEAKPPFYREVLEEGVRRGDVVSREQFGRVVFDTTFDERQAVRDLRAELEAERQRAILAETQLREVKGHIRWAIDAIEAGRYPYALSVLLSSLAGTEKS